MLDRWFRIHRRFIGYNERAVLSLDSAVLPTKALKIRKIVRRKSVQDLKSDHPATDTINTGICQENIEMHERLSKIERQLSTFVNCNQTETHRNCATTLLQILKMRVLQWFLRPCKCEVMMHTQTTYQFFDILWLIQESTETYVSFLNLRVYFYFLADL